MMKQELASFRDKRVLLLQGPLGPFFRRLACDLKSVGAEVIKINFNGGDWLFYPTKARSFRGKLSGWPEFFEQLLVQEAIDVVLLFGDCRPVHDKVREISHRHGVEIGVFEEGYIRPDYITFESSGVNGHSLIPCMPDFYFRIGKLPLSPPLRIGKTFPFVMLWAMGYYLASALLWPFFPRYQHHRPFTLLEVVPWLRSGWRKLFYRIREYGIQQKLVYQCSKRYFLVPLQVHNDAQLHFHSNFASVEAFIQHVIGSFAENAPKDTILVIKHHPMDRGYHDYRRFINKLSRHWRLEQRLLYIHDQHLPSLLTHARGVVVVNSTVGLSALYHGAPTKVLGRAMYDMEGLTFQGSLDEFWQQAEHAQVDRQLFTNFRRYLIAHTQINGNFYKRLPETSSATGLRW